MKQYHINRLFLFYTLLCVGMSSCLKEENKFSEFEYKAVVVNTLSATNLAANSATVSGEIVSPQSRTMTRGVCWSTLTNPTILNNKVEQQGSNGTFSINLTGLTTTTTYYARAYATDTKSTVYGEKQTFTTLASLSTITTILIPAGIYTMGSSISEVSRSNDETQHRVTLSAFRMSICEITNTQYAAFLNTKGIGSNGLYELGAYPTQVLIVTDSSWGLTYTNSQWTPVAGYETSPVINVTWYGATEFATYIGGTLPTEAQWEYACRAGTITPFNTGSCLTNTDANYNWSSSYGTCINAIITPLSKTQPVGICAPNSFGLYDMHGNVLEWCSDWHGLYPASAQTNPKGASTGSYRVFRGGSWSYSAQGCRSANRSYNIPSSNYNNVGFRVVFAP